MESASLWTSAGTGAPDALGALLDELRERGASPPSTEPLRNFFNLLNAAGKEEVDKTCEILELCFSRLSVSAVAENASNYLVEALQHKNSNVRLMAINEILRAISNSNNLYNLPEFVNGAIEIVRCLKDQDIKVAARAMEILTLTDWLKFPPVMDEFDNVLSDSDASSRCRCYDICISIVKKTPEAIKDIENIEKNLHKLISELETDDFLLQVNILELLSSLSIVPHGLNFIIENDVLKIISKLVENITSNPLCNLIIPGLMKFFGSIAYKYPTEIYNNYPAIVDALFDTIHNNNQSVLPTALDTLGFVGVSIEGKLALGSLGRVFIDALPEIGNYIKNSSTEMRVRAMECVENLVKIKPSEVDTEGEIMMRVTLMTREWFRTLSERPSSMDLIFSICKNPFPELRLSALKILLAVCQHKWGAELVKAAAGLVEFLLDRSVEHDKESKETKYEIISTLCKSTVFSESTLILFNEYVKEGPFFVQGETRVATEGDE